MILKNLNKDFKGKVIYKDTSIEFDNIGIHVLYGPSGSGKSTLINILLGIDKTDEINYIIDGKKLSANEIDSFRQKNIGYMSQSLGIIEQFTVYQNIKLYDDNIKDEEIIKILKELEIEDLKEAKGKSLSGGQRQRVRLARSLVRDKKIIIMDEPTNNLDDKNVKVIIELLKKLSKDKILIIATHDTRVISEANYIHEIKDKKILTEEVFPTNKKVEYNNQITYKFRYLKYSIQTFKSLFMVKSIPIFLMVFGVLILSTFLSDLNKEKATYEDHLMNLQPGLIFVSGDSRENSDGIYTNDKNEESLLSEEDVQKLKENEDIYNVYIKSSVLTEDNDLQKYIMNSEQIITDEILQEYYEKVYKIDESKVNLDNKEIYYYFYEALPYDMFSNNITSLEESYVEILEGDYPKDNTNEILLPKTLADTYGKNIVGEVINYNGKEYVVSGIYNDVKYIEQAVKNPIAFESYSSKVQNKIYYSYTDKAIPTEEQMTDFYEENQILFTNSGINNYEQYKANYQDGIVNVIINYNPQKDEEVYKYIEDLGLSQDSRYTMYLQHQDDFQRIKEKKLVSTLILFLIFLVFFSLIYKYRFAFRQEEFNLLFDNGLMPKEVRRLLIIEAFIDTIIVLLLLFLILGILNLLSVMFNISGLMIGSIDLFMIMIFVLLSLIMINIYNLHISIKKRGK